MNDDFTIGQHLEKYIGQGAILSFKKDNSFRSALVENNILKLNFLEGDIFAGLVKEKNRSLMKWFRGLWISDRKTFCIMLMSHSI